MSFTLQQHHHSPISQLHRVAVWCRVWLLLPVLLVLSQPDTAHAAPPPRFQPDGAPGENLAPGEAVDRLAQVEKDQAEPAEDEVIAEEAEPVPEDDPRASQNLDNIDFRAPINRSKQNTWQKIEQAAQGGDWKQVLDRLDRFAGPIDRPESGDYLVRHADGSLKSARFSLAELLAKMPANLRLARARAEEAVANALLEQAIRENNHQQLNQIAVRFFGTPIGYRAADRLATQLIDRGEFTLAAQWLKLLLNSDSMVNQSAAWQKKTRLVLSLTGTSQDLKTGSAILAQLRSQFVTAEPASLSDWPLLGGNSRRHAEPAVTSPPVMIRRWEFSTTSSSELKSTIDQLLADLTYRAVPTIPAGAPIFVNGKVICRTFRGIEVLAAESGQHLWSTAQSASVERLLGSASPDSRNVADLTRNMSPLLSATVAVDRTGGPIGQFLFQNAAHGLISSDGEQVYFLEDDPVFTLGRTSIRRVDGGNASPRPESTTSNRLKAYDLETGQPAWQVGGPDTREPFAPELAGWFFLGTPLPDRGDLFIVAQKENAIRLFCLDPETGSARWSQQIAFAEEGLERNLNRRLWSAQLAVAHGVVVCPTTVGWLVGVDRSTGTIVWSHRYSERQDGNGIGTPGLFRGNRGRIELANESIGGSWIPSAPIVMGDRIVFAPSEPRDESDNTTRFLDCVNVFTGERLWSLPRETALAVTGGSQGQTIVTWPGSVMILNPDGSQRAKIDFNTEDGLPCGRGIVAKGSFWLPLQRQVLLRFDLEQKKLAERIEVAAGYPPLGNLAFYQGLLISHAPEGITAWELEETLNSRLATVQSAGDPDQAAILAAQLALSRKEFSSAIEILLPRLSAYSDTSLHQSILGMLMQAASGQIDTSPESGLALLQRVQPLFESSGLEGASYELQRRHLEVEALLILNRPTEAFEKLLAMVSLSSSGTMQRVDDTRITVAVDAWLQRQLHRVWQQVPNAEQERLTAKITQLQAHSENTSSDKAARLTTLFRFHSSSLASARKLADSAMSENRFADAEHWLDQIADTGTDSDAAAAILKQLQIRSSHGTADADTHDLIGQLQTQYSSTVLPDGASAVTALKPVLSRLRNRSEISPSDWGDISLAGIRTPVSQQRALSPRLISDRPSSRFRIEIQTSRTGANRLSFFERATNELFWTVSLRSNNGQDTSSSRRLTVYRTGQLFAVLSRGVLNMLSVPERRVLWTQPVDELDSARRTARRRGRPLEDIDEWLLRRRAGSMNAVPVANSHYLCSRASRSITVYDSRTGQLRWRLEPLERSLRIFGTHNTIYLTRPDGTIWAAHHAIDGKPVQPDPFLTELFESATVVQVDDHSIVTVNRDGESGTTLQAHSPSTREELWKHTLSKKLKARMISNNQLAILAPLGRIKLLDFRTGILTEFEKIPPSLRFGNPEYTLLADNRLLYVILKREAASEAEKPGLPSAHINGNLIALDLKSGSLAWTQELPEQHLLTERLDQLPFLIMTGHRSEFILQPSDLRRVMVIDKRDGKILLDTKDEPGEAAFHSMIIDTRNQQVDLISSAERFRLKAIPAVNPDLR